MSKKIINIFIFFVIFITFIFYVNINISTYNVKIKNGFLDLRKVNFSKNKCIRLSGDWEQYPNKLLSPKNFLKQKTKSSIFFAKVTDTSNNFLFIKHTSSNTGYSTYRIKITLPQNINYVSFLFKDISPAYKLYINGENVLNIGTMGNNKSTFKPEFRTGISHYKVQKNTLELILQTSNFHYNFANQYGDILIGTPTSIQNKNTNSTNSEIFFIGSIFMISIFCLGFYSYRQSNTETLYFSLFSTFVALKILVSGNHFLKTLIPNLNYVCTIKLQYLSLFSLIPLLSLYIYNVYKENFSKTSLYIIEIISLIFMFTTLFVNSLYFNYSLYGYAIYSMVWFIFIVYKFIKRLLTSNLNNFEFYNFSIIFFMLYILNALNVNTLLNSNEINNIIIWIFLIIQSFTLSNRLSNSYSYAEVLALKNLEMYNDIKTLNETLEEKVQERTEELILKNQQLNKLIKMDGLTNLYNHKYIFSLLEKEITSAKINKNNLSILMCDIDNFKKINDSYGHQFGDEILVALSKVLKFYTPKGSSVGRYGGEEFLIVFVNKDLKETHELAEKIRISIENLPFKDKHFKVTISIGICQFKDEDCMTLVNKADKLLYLSKSNGKNRTSF